MTGRANNARSRIRPIDLVPVLGTGKTDYKILRKSIVDSMAASPTG